MGRRPTRLLVTAFLLLAGAAAARAASFPPELRFRSLKGRLATVHYHDPLEPMARRALALADEILARHALRYRVTQGRVQIVLADVFDDPNGFPPRCRTAVPCGSSPPRDRGLRQYDGWLRLLLTTRAAPNRPYRRHAGWSAWTECARRAPFLFPNASTGDLVVVGCHVREPSGPLRPRRKRRAEVSVWPPL